MDNVIASSAHLKRMASAADMAKAGRVVMATGRGGTGKSTFTALASRYLEPPQLLLDLDPDQSLADMLGVDLDTARVTTETGREVAIRTISDLTSDILDEDALIELGGGPPVTKIPNLVDWYAIYHGDRFDLVSLGPKWSSGDYRSENFLFEFIVPSFGRHYRSILIDSPAGLEHLNRRVIPAVDDLFILLDPSHKSLKHIARVKRIAAGAGMTYKHLYLVGNCEFDEESEKLITGTGETYLGRIDHDAGVKDYNLRGESLLNLPDSSPACLSVRRILARAGY